MFDFLLFCNKQKHTYNRGKKESFASEIDPNDQVYNPAEEKLGRRPTRNHSPKRRINGANSKKNENKKIGNKKNEAKKNPSKKNEKNKSGKKKNGKDKKKNKVVESDTDDDNDGAHSSDEDIDGQWTENELKWKRWCKGEIDSRNHKVMKFLRKWNEVRNEKLTKKAVQQVWSNSKNGRDLDYKLGSLVAKKSGRKSKSDDLSQENEKQPLIDSVYTKLSSQENNNNDNNENEDIDMLTKGDGNGSDRTESVEIEMKGNNGEMARFKEDAKTRQIANLRESQMSYVLCFLFVLYVVCIVFFCIMYFLYYVLFCVLVLCIIYEVFSFFVVLFDVMICCLIF